MSDALRSFGTFLAEVEDGELHADLTRQLAELVTALREGHVIGASQTKGRLALSLDLTLSDGIVEVRGECKVTGPKRARPRSVFWITTEDQLTRRNPRQPDLPFRDVNGSVGAVRTVS